MDFALFSTPVDLAHGYWKRLLAPGDSAIDATCGNGRDTLFLAELLQDSGVLIGLDIQHEALTRTRALLQSSLTPIQLARVHLFLQSHTDLPPLALEKGVKLIIYNLGYLPGGDKKITSQMATTLVSVNKSLSILPPGGALSITCYPGHEEGMREQQALLELFASLPPSLWSVCHHQWVNRTLSPSLFFIQRKIT